MSNIKKTEQQWQQCLTPEEYRVTRLKGTEPPGTGEFYHHHEVGTYFCRCCQTPLFDSDSKYASGSGWPSFFQSLENKSITETRDLSHGMVRVEISCSNCGSHLGHVFEDGPKPTGLRYCVNSISLIFEPKQIEP